MKKDMEYREIMTNYENKQKVFYNMKVNYEQDMEVNSELKLNIEDQQDDIKHFFKMGH